MSPEANLEVAGAARPLEYGAAGNFVPNCRDIPDDVFAAGNPCRVIRDISQENRMACNK